MGEVERRRPDHRARRHDLGQQPEGGRGARDGQGLGRHHLAAGRARLQGRGVAAASGRPATRSSCATGPMPMRSATATTARSRASSTWRRCRPAAATARSAATLGGWNVAVSQVFAEPGRGDRAGQVHRLDRDAEAARAEGSQPADDPARSTTMPTSPRQQPIIPRWKDVFLNAVPRPSAPTKVAYNEVSASSGPRCTRRCRATAPPPTTSSCSRSTSTR